MGGRLYRISNDSLLDVEERRTRLNPNTEIGWKLQQVRYDRDLTQWQLSEMASDILTRYGAIGLPRYGASVVSLIESGRRSLSAPELFAFCSVLRIDNPMAFAPWRNLNDYDVWLPAKYDRSLMLIPPLEAEQNAESVC